MKMIGKYGQNGFSAVGSPFSDKLLDEAWLKNRVNL
jgi:hypothetical protein